jgi:hypothetical protein
MREPRRGSEAFGYNSERIGHEPTSAGNRHRCEAIISHVKLWRNANSEVASLDFAFHILRISALQSDLCLRASKVPHLFVVYLATLSAAEAI